MTYWSAFLRNNNSQTSSEYSRYIKLSTLGGDAKVSILQGFCIHQMSVENDIRLVTTASTGI